MARSQPWTSNAVEPQTPVSEGQSPRLFGAPYAPADEAIASDLFAQVTRPAAAEERINAHAARLIEGIRARTGGLGGIEDFLHAYSLSTKEGLALMVLAEAVLRVPEAATADRLIEDKLARGEWSSQDLKSHALLVSASAWTLGMSARIIHPGETPDTILDSLLKRLGLPALRAAIRQAMRLLGSHFVVGQTIEGALGRGCAPVLCVLRRRHRGDCAIGRYNAPSRAARHFRQVFGAASALRGHIARSPLRRASAYAYRSRRGGTREQAP